MGKIDEYLASYTTSLKFDDIPLEVVHKAKELFIDALGCAMGGYDSEPSRIACSIAGNIYHCNTPATVIGSGQKTTPELAAFANGIMIRYLDFNDDFVSSGGGHPSDNFAPVLTCADAVHASGKEFLTASILAYEVFCRLGDKISAKGFDQTVQGVISSVVGVSKILGLFKEQILQAINLAIVPNIALGQTRVGELSMWKGCAMANAARNAIFAALLAKEGMTGPSPIFEGRQGLFEVVTGRFDLEEFGGKNQSFRILEVSIKRYPCNKAIQTAIDAAIKLRSKISNLGDIAKIFVGTFSRAKNSTANDVEKWHPATRETADHSLPFVVAVALMYGSVEKSHFAEQYMHNSDILTLMQKIEVADTEECNKLYPDGSPNRLELVTKSGERFSEMVQYHHGHFLNPLTDEEIEQKFCSLTKDLLPAAQRKALLSLVWNLEQVSNITEMMEYLKVNVTA